MKSDLSQFAADRLDDTSCATRRWWSLRALVIGLIYLGCTGANAQEISFSSPDLINPISVDASEITSWRQGQLQVIHLHGGVAISQERFNAAADDAILWIHELPEPNTYKVVTYLESLNGNVVIELGHGSNDPTADSSLDRIVDATWLGRLYTNSSIDSAQPAAELQGEPPAVFIRAQQMLEQGRSTSVIPAQFPQQPQRLISPQTGQIQEVIDGPAPRQDPFQGQFDLPPQMGPILTGQQPMETLPGQLPNSVLPDMPGFSSEVRGSGSQVNITARDSTVDLNLRVRNNPENTNESIWVGTGGVRVTIDSPEITRSATFQGDGDQQVVILADNVVAWQSAMYDGNDRWEIYLEGNVVFAKDRRVIYSKQMYYDVNGQRGTILNADILTPVREYQGLVRLKADVIEQVDQNQMQAYGAAFTTSRMGVPRYWAQAERIGLTRERVVDDNYLTGEPVYDPVTGYPVVEEQYFIEGKQNRVYVSGVPVFAWPSLRTNLSDPSIYLNSLRIGNDQIFGFQVLTNWNLLQLVGVKSPPKGIEVNGLLSYLSKRGVGFGTETQYQRDSFLGLKGPARGFYYSWYIDDHGLDNLGRGRRNLVPEKRFRGRSIWNHRQNLDSGYDLRAELGWISDRDFLNEYYEREWDQNKDATTGFWLEKNIGTRSSNLLAQFQINDFFTQTSWWPRYDHFLIGQPAFMNRAVRYGRSTIGYANMKAATAPTNPTELAMFYPLPWQGDVGGLRAGTRQELDLPQQFGPVKVIPYLLGDATYWQEDLAGNDMFRAFGQTGIKASLPFWKVDPTIQSTLWNLNGLAHKVSFDVDAFYAKANQNLDLLPMYDPLNDDSQEAFEQRYAVNQFGLAPGDPFPARYDPRYYALRSGIQGNVSSPTTEIAGSLATVRMGIRQRWQTKRGMPGEERIVDWVTFDLGASYFPDADRDNFGANFGMLNYDFRWHVGDRVSLVSDGHMDFFEQGLQTASFGMFAGRPAVGNIYIGFRTIDGPITSNVLSSSLLYRLSDKWGIRGLSQIDFGETGTIGQGLGFVYIGESFLWQLGFNYDASRDNFGFRIGFEPRFTKSPRLFNPGGVPVGPAGSRWLE
ncbi:MAG: organic solvent tolerance protein OstA [Mariniblastus sp.]|nr:organic solvent tolerance protein OstA [Mariniblastus sp.]